MFNVFNNQNLLAGGYINLVGNPRFGAAHGRIGRPSRPPVPVRDDVSILKGSGIRGPGSGQGLRTSLSCDVPVSRPAVYCRRTCSNDDLWSRSHCPPSPRSATTVDAQGKPVRVRVQTELGDIVVEVDQAKAPVHGGQLPQVRRCRSLRRRDVASHRQDGQSAGEHGQDRGDPGWRQSPTRPSRASRRSRSSAPA